MNQALKSMAEFLQQKQITPCVLDIGCTGGPTYDFAELKSTLHFIGVEPDQRAFSPEPFKGFKKVSFINEILVADHEKTQTEFYLTQYPSCSSLLEPNLTELKPMAFHDYFTVVKKENLACTSLSRVLAKHQLTNFDWLKIDSQGYDLELLKSLPATSLQKTLAVEIEPGFVPAYKNEAYFTQVHNWLIEHDFILVNFKTQDYPRISRERIDQLADKLKFNANSMPLLREIMGTVPTCAEARYFLSPQAVAKSQDQDLMIKAIAFACLDKQIGYAFEILEQGRDVLQPIFTEIEHFIQECVIENLSALQKKRRSFPTILRKIAGKTESVQEKLRHL